MNIHVNAQLIKTQMGCGFELRNWDSDEGFQITRFSVIRNNNDQYIYCPYLRYLTSLEHYSGEMIIGQNDIANILKNVKLH